MTQAGVLKRMSPFKVKKTLVDFREPIQITPLDSYV